jgi:DNA-directed RNA polymerase subunit RPC12/RpoP
MDSNVRKEIEMATEKRLIDAKALKSLFRDRYDRAFMQMHSRAEREYWDGVCCGVNWGLNTIIDAPTVDAVEVVHGEWDTIEDDYTGMIALQCSECSQEYWFEDEPPLKIYNYCPNCGAKMDGDNK